MEPQFRVRSERHILQKLAQKSLALTPPNSFFASAGEGRGDILRERGHARLHTARPLRITKNGSNQRSMLLLNSQEVFFLRKEANVHNAQKESQDASRISQEKLRGGARSISCPLGGERSPDAILSVGTRSH